MQEILNIISNNSDTLRYFYSAIFQGFAAIITLGSMFYIYFRQQIENRKDELKKNMEHEYRSSPPIYKKINNEIIITFTRNFCKKNIKT